MCTGKEGKEESGVEGSDVVKHCSDVGRVKLPSQSGKRQLGVWFHSIAVVYQVQSPGIDTSTYTVKKK